MMNLIRITNPDDRNLNRLIALYEDAFPVEERRDIGQLKRMIKQKSDMYFNAIECDGELCGFFVYWDMKDFYYLEHLAVYPSMRNKKLGQKVLDYAANHLKGVRLLEVEPIRDEMTTRRVRYYQRNGYQVLDEEYIQPSYDGVRDSCPLWIMGNRHSERLPEFIDTIKRKVYLDNYGLIEK